MGGIMTDHRLITEALARAAGYFRLRDRMNAVVHTEEPRWSPITKLVMEASDAWTTQNWEVVDIKVEEQ